jgi:hypothetical protein
MPTFADMRLPMMKDGRFNVDEATKELIYADTMGTAGDLRLPLADTDAVTRPVMLPTQAGGTCYFHAFMNAIVNKPAFKKELMDHLWRRVRSNKFFLPGPNVALAAVPGRVRQIVRDSGSEGTCGEKFAWIHDTVMLHALGSAKSVHDVRKGELDVEATHAVLLRRQSSIRDILAKPLPPRSGSLFGKLLSKDDRLSQQVVDALKGGSILDAAARVMTSCGLTVTHHVKGDSMIAEIPGSGDSPRAIFAMKLVNVHSRRKNISEPTECTQLMTNGLDRTGVLTVSARGKGGHALAYVREGVDDPRYVSIIDSNGYFLPDLNHNFFPLRALNTLGYGDTMETYTTYSAVSSTTGMVGGGELTCDEPDLRDLGHMLLMVDEDVHALDANTAAAIEALLDMVHEDLEDPEVPEDPEPQAGGARTRLTWAGLALVTVVASFMGSF